MRQTGECEALLAAGLSHHEAYIDISQDLRELAVRGESLLAQDPASVLERELIPRARACSAELFRRASGGDLPVPPEPDFLRTYTTTIKELRRLIKRIRDIGKIAFRNDPDHRKAYFVDQ